MRASGTLRGIDDARDHPPLRPGSDRRNGPDRGRRRSQHGRHARGARPRRPIRLRDHRRPRPAPRRAGRTARGPPVRTTTWTAGGGRATIEDLFPGYCDSLVDAGGVPVDSGTEVRTYDDGVPLARGGTESTTMYCATRPLFDLIVRRYLRDNETVTLRESCQFVESVVNEEVTAVRGVRIRDETGETVELSADLVVDATGRAVTSATNARRAGRISLDRRRNRKKTPAKA